jgi:hypothetical protein
MNGAQAATTDAPKKVAVRIIRDEPSHTHDGEVCKKGDVIWVHPDHAAFIVKQGAGELATLSTASTVAEAAGQAPKAAKVG